MLTKKQSKFVNLFAETFDPHWSAKEAGYSIKSIHSTVYQLFASRTIRSAIFERVALENDETLNKWLEFESTLPDLIDDLKNGTIYLIKASNGLYKIGVTTNLIIRLRSLQSGSPLPLTLEWSCTCNDVNSIESHLHEQFKLRHSHFEWFRLSDRDIEYIYLLSTNTIYRI